MPMDFTALGIERRLTDTLRAHGVQEPTPIQQQAIPNVLQGYDLIGQAQTGTGKTLAFLLPILERLDVNSPHTQALIVTPTRELALQITDEAKKLASKIGATVLAAYGGQDVAAQVHKLKSGIHIVIATPGRLLDHLRRETIQLDQVKTLVLDEADQMLHMGFKPEVEQIISYTPKNRQTLLFSATMPDAIRAMSKQYLRNPLEVKVEGKRVTLEEIKQVVVETTDRNKQETLIHALKQYNPYLAVVFCRTKRRAAALNGALVSAGFETEELHGDLTQAKREKVMKAFRDARFQVLVATDVAARGLDVEGVTHVFNYDIPPDVESYIHRIGRTGRAGSQGMAITFVAPRDRATIALIEQGIQGKIQKLDDSLRPITNANRESYRGDEPNTGVGAASRGGRGRNERSGRDDRAGRGDRGRKQEPSRGRSGARAQETGGRGKGRQSAAADVNYKSGTGRGKQVVTSGRGYGPGAAKDWKSADAGRGRDAGAGRGGYGAGRGADADAGRGGYGAGRGADAGAGRGGYGAGRGADAGAGRGGYGAGRGGDAGAGRGGYGAGRGGDAGAGRGGYGAGRGGNAPAARGGYGAGRGEAADGDRTYATARGGQSSGRGGRTFGGGGQSAPAGRGGRGGGGGGGGKPPRGRGR